MPCPNKPSDDWNVRFVSCAGATWTSAVYLLQMYCFYTVATDLCVYLQWLFQLYWFSVLLLCYLVTCNNSFCQFTESLACILPTPLTLSAIDTFSLVQHICRKYPISIILIHRSTAHRNLPCPRCPKTKRQLVKLFRMIVTGVDFQLKIF